MPGDAILLAGGQLYTGSLDLPSTSAGTVNRPITITSYGTGRASICSPDWHGIYLQGTSGSYELHDQRQRPRGHRRLRLRQHRGDAAHEDNVNVEFRNNLGSSGDADSVTIGSSSAALNTGLNLPSSFGRTPGSATTAAARCRWVPTTSEPASGPSRWPKTAVGTPSGGYFRQHVPVPSALAAVMWTPRGPGACQPGPLWSRREVLRCGTGLGVLGLGALAAGCSGVVTERTLPRETGPTPGSAVAYGRADIDWQAAKGTNLLFTGSTHQWVSAVTALRPAFMELTGIDLRMEVGGETELGRILPGQLAAGAPSPDVFMVPSYGQAVAAGWLEPLDDYLEDPARTDAAWYRLDDVYPSSMDFVRWRGRTYGLPITAEAQTTIYRTDLIDPPPATFEEVLEAARGAKQRGGVSAGIALRGKPTAGAVAWPAAGYVFTYGGYLIDPDGRSALASPETVRGVQMYADVLRAGGADGAAGWDWREINAAMQSGRAAMMQDSSNAIPDLQDPARSSVSDRIAAVAFPTHEGRSNPNLWHWIVGMNANSRNKTGAWLFLLWATSKTTGLELARAGVTPPRASAWADPSFQEDFGEQESLVVLDELQLLDSRPMTAAWMHPKWPQVGDAFARAVTAAATTDARAAETLAVAHQQATAVLG